MVVEVIIALLKINFKRIYYNTKEKKVFYKNADNMSYSKQCYSWS